MNDPVVFTLAVLAMLATPGPTNTLMATSGATVGIRRSVVLLAAEISGYLIAITAIHLVIARLAEAYPVTGAALRVAVALYLVWLAVRLWRRPLVPNAGRRAVTFPNVLVTTLLNPKAIVIALTIMPWQAEALRWYLTGFVALVAAAGCGWIVLGSMLGAAAGSRARYISRIAAAALVGFAGFILRSAL